MSHRHSDDYDARDCYDPNDDLKTGFCSDCGQECVVGVVDEGIGHYEYWGAKGVDIRLVEVSSCCGADVLDEPPLEEDEDE